MKTIQVVAGIIFNPSRTQVLIALRKPEQHQGNCWEFPGGKLDADESQKAALVRELLEEIGIDVLTAVHRVSIEHRYPDKQVQLHFWDVSDFAGEPLGREGQQLKWTPIAQLRTFRFSEANQSIVDALCSELA